MRGGGAAFGSWNKLGLRLRRPPGSAGGAGDLAAPLPALGPLRAEPAERSERKLIRAAKRGSKEAFGELFRMHWPRVHRASYLIVRDSAAAEDIAQEAFMAALRHLDRFDARRPLGPWLNRIVVNRSIDWTRTSAHRAARCTPIRGSRRAIPAPTRPAPAGLRRADGGARPALGRAPGGRGHAVPPRLHAVGDRRRPRAARPAPSTRGSGARSISSAPTTRRPPMPDLRDRAPRDRHPGGGGRASVRRGG